MEIDAIKDAIRLAKEAVKDEEEPFRIEAFKIVLAKLLEGDAKQEQGLIPERILDNIDRLTNKEKIQLILYYSNKPLSKEEIKEKSKELGIDEGWWHGSNFRRDLMKRNKLLIEEKGEDGIVRYRLSELAKVSTKKLIEELS